MTMMVGPRQVVSLYIFPDAVHHLIDNHPPENTDDQSFSTPLDFATIKGDLNVAELLIQNGANASQPNENQNTPVDFRAHHGRLDIAHLLLKIEFPRSRWFHSTA